MNISEFRVLQQLATRGLSDGSVIDAAARDVMVYDVAVKDAALLAGIKPSRLEKKIERLHEVRTEVLKAYKVRTL